MKYKNQREEQRYAPRAQPQAWKKVLKHKIYDI